MNKNMSLAVRLCVGIALSICIGTAAAQEIILDDVPGAKFSTVGTWTVSASVNSQGGSLRYHSPGTSGIVTLDNDEPGTQAVGTWQAVTNISGYWGADARLAGAGTGDRTYSWTLTSKISQAASYRVYARWTAHANRGSNVAYSIIHNGGTSAVTVNQQQNGGQWNLLGTYTLTSTKAKISVSNNANGNVSADAVQVIPVSAFNDKAVWDPQLTGPTRRYDVYAKWTTHANRATNAPYTVVHAGGQATVVANQQQNGNQWNLLGNFVLNSGSEIRLSVGGTNGYVIADAIRLVPTAGTVHYIHSDHLNTPRVVTDAQNQVVWRNLPLTEPFGSTVPEEDPDGNGTSFVFNQRFPGQYFDKETNLSYNYFRDYDPQLGRYVQSDPIGLQGGINTYAYVGGNPVSNIDPEGLMSGSKPGGPYHPPDGVKTKCRPTDSCGQMLGKLWVLGRMIVSHQGWDGQCPPPHGGGRHATEIRDLWTQYADCQAMAITKCAQACRNIRLPVFPVFIDIFSELCAQGDVMACRLAGEDPWGAI